ncbi:complex I NDUFA9 subunit family protein [Halomonas sp. TRM85114]|uniref:complex I NDUFA9 subunit family protein n=1 Tax=Halomonas jincaotanensis TaxID=2810616 RepID=UPI001BD49782|nr:complex I NDUFA9 subunit family protein [Halomonas jincaotanensis]MBS9405127.1 complex I NDUFA9 subunit family protein [Halomonas jincaotanensis]
MPAQLITVFGGTGFLGRAIVRELVDAGQRVRIAARHPVMPLHTEGGEAIELVRADIRESRSVKAAVGGADSVVNAVSLYVEQPGASFETIHVEGAARLASLARQAGIERLVHISGIGARTDSPSPYVRARAEGESAVLEALPGAIIVRLSVLFGPDDAFLTTLAGLTRMPVIPLFGHGHTRLQPVHVTDVARALIRLLGEPLTQRRLFELGGPDVMRYRDILTLLMAHLHRERPLVPLPFFVWRVLAATTSLMKDPPLTTDQVILMQQDTLASRDVGTFRDLGIVPRSLRDSLPTCLPNS